MDRCFAIWIAVIAGIIIGIIEATLWILGYIPLINAVVPYATAAAMLIFGLTPLLALTIRPAQPPSGCQEHGQPGNPCAVPYVRTIMIAAAVFLIFVQIQVGTVLPFVLNAILAFVGSVSFWIMLLAFLAFVFDLIRRRLQSRVR